MAKQKDVVDFSKIEAKDILWALQSIDENGIPPRTHSSTYDILFKENRYSLNYVVSLAYKHATGSELSRNLFPGGKDTDCFKTLENLNFVIVPKKIDTDFYPTIQKFIEQAHTNNLTTRDYIKTFNGLNVKVSFGQGNSARIPWISFLYKGQNTSNGIYPVYLYYKEYDLLILAYGISETETPTKRWILKEDTETIKSYLSKQGHKADRYGGSYVFRSYKIDSLSENTINNDLDIIIQQYKQQMNDDPMEEFKNSLAEEDFSIFKLPSDIQKTGLIYDENLLLRFTVSLMTKPFVILSGLSGSGKTQLALIFARWICKDDSQIRIVPVGADWTNREYLLGYPNALTKGCYVSPEHGALTILIEAKKNPNKPYFLILDEMNLSHVERYFADFLSAMESHESISLHPDDNDWTDCPIPNKIKLPGNLFIIGTINVDETTYMFSPKVLDRANVIEFKVTSQEMGAFLSKCQPIEKSVVNGLGANMASSFVNISKEKIFSDLDISKYQPFLLLLFNELKKVGAEFGYRSALEIFRYIHLAKELKINWTNDQIFDMIIIQKLLPKLHGARKKMQPILDILWENCLNEENKQKKMDVIQITDDFDKYCKYPLSAEKIWRMNRSASENGFTSFAEA